MLCPKCNSVDDKVIDSRLSKEGNSIRRRRECLKCAHRFTTYEEIEHLKTFIIKRDGRRENLDRQKLLTSFLKACEKRPVALEMMEQAASSVLNNLDFFQQREVQNSLATRSWNSYAILIPSPTSATPLFIGASKRLVNSLMKLNH